MVKGVTSVTWVRGKGLEGLFVGYRGERHLRNPAPEGRASLAQRFSAGKSLLSDVSWLGAARRIDEVALLLQFFPCTFSGCGVLLNVSTVLPNRRDVLKNKAPLILLLLFFLVFGLWAQKAEPPQYSPAPPSEIHPQEA